jgi:hypothetical protein
MALTVTQKLNLQVQLRWTYIVFKKTWAHRGHDMTCVFAGYVVLLTVVVVS